jgi:CheY-like chemotaxis protein
MTAQILIVDDDEFWREDIRGRLVGYNILEAGSVDEACQKIEEYKQTIDLIILDLELLQKTNKSVELHIFSEKISGRNVLSFLRRKGYQIPCLLFSIHQFPIDTITTLKTEYEGVVDGFSKSREGLQSLARKVDEILQADKSCVSIMFIAAEPIDQGRLRVSEEWREIKQELTLAVNRTHFRFDEQFAVRPKDFSRVIMEKKPRIVHFSGHGSGKPGLCLENEAGQTQLTPTKGLAEMFEVVASQVECVILNACYAKPQATAIARHIKYVIGTKRQISDKAAIAFSVGFYQALGSGNTIEDAYKAGCAQIMLQNIPAQLKPILLKDIAKGAN